MAAMLDLRHLGLCGPTKFVLHRIPRIRKHICRHTHWDALNDLLYTMCFHNFLLDFIGLTEVFHIENDQHFTLKGYHQLEFNTRPSSDDAHGGVALFIHEKLNYIRRDDLSIFIPHVMETLFVEIQYKHSKPIIVGVIYRPNTLPRADLDLFISNLLEIQSKISNENKISYLMGDYNINLLNFGIHSKTNEFIDDVISQGFLPYILKPTRVTDTSATLTDHFGVFHITYDTTNKTEPTYLYVRQLKDSNIKDFKNILAQTDFSEVLNNADPDGAYNCFLHVYSSLFDKACPIKYIRATSKYIKREPWITGGMMISIINKSKLYRKKINKPNEQNINNYKLYSNIFNKLKKTAKAKYYTDMLDIHKHSIKETWAVLRQVYEQKQTICKTAKCVYCKWSRNVKLKTHS